jgi:hypothetical protein
MPRARAVAVAPPSVGGCDAAAADRSERLPSRQGIRGTSTYPKAYHDPASIRGRGHSAQRKSMAKQKDATGRCTVRPQRAKDGTVDRPKVGRGGKGGDLADIYGLLYARVPFNTPTDVALAREFSDKELRVLMGMNKMLINDYDPKTGKYTEKTKQNKIRVLLPNIANLSHPEDLSPVAKAKRGARSAPAVESQDNDGVDGGASANTAVPLATLPTGGRQTAWPDCGLGVVEDVPGGVHGAHMSEPDSPIEDPSASSDGGEDAEWAHSLRAFAHPNAEWASQHPVFQAAGAKFDLQFESGLGTSPHKMVTPLSLPAGSYEYEVANASGYVCAAMAVHFSSSCREGRSPRSESAETMQQNVLQVGVEAYRRSVAGELDRSTSMDEVVANHCESWTYVRFRVRFDTHPRWTQSYRSLSMHRVAWPPFCTGMAVFAISIELGLLCLSAILGNRHLLCWTHERATAKRASPVGLGTQQCWFSCQQQNCTSICCSCSEAREHKIPPRLIGKHLSLRWCLQKH